MSIKENRTEFLAGRYDLPVFSIYVGPSTARLLASDGQPGVLLAIDRGNKYRFFTEGLPLYDMDLYGTM